MCVLLPLWDPPVAPWDELRAVAEGSSPALLIVPSLLKILFLNLSRLSGIMSESRRLKQMVTEPFLSSTHPWCYSVVRKKWKAESYLGGESWTVSCCITIHFIWNYCQMLFFPSPSHSNSHYFYERFLCNRLKKNRRKFLLVPCRAFCSFPFLLRPCNIGINSLLIEMVMSCWHFITVNVVTVIFNSSSEGGIASPLNTLVFSAAKAGSRCWVNNSYMWVQKNALWHLF